jgi:hypothetical protein
MDLGWFSGGTSSNAIIPCAVSDDDALVGNTPTRPFITKYGWFVAMITPLAFGQLGTTSPG